MNDIKSPQLDEGFIVETLLIQKTEVPTRIGMMKQSLLRFYSENPRVYSIVREDGKDPSQEDIQAKLEDMDHVRELREDIQRHGGLIDPLVVKDGSLEVVEGNSRLAAYRVLARRSPSKWAMVRVRLLPADIDEKLVASLLGQWHLRGKKEWPPYEQAGYLYRRSNEQKVSAANLAAESGLTIPRVEKMIEAFQLMVDQGDTKRDRWSYYDEFVKSRKIAKVCEAQQGFRDRVLTMVKEGQFERAQDLRDKLPVICDASPKILAKFASGKLDLEQAFEQARDAGGDTTEYQRLHKFRQWLAEHEVQDVLNSTEGALSDKIDFELKRLQAIVSTMLKKRQPDS